MTTRNPQRLGGLTCLAALMLALGCGGDDGAAGDDDGASSGGSGAATSGGDDDGQDGPGDGNDDAGDDGDDDGGTDAGSGDDAEDDGPDDGMDGNDDGPSGTCQPVPLRMIVLGDSIAACSNVGGGTSGNCAFNQLHDHYAETYGPTSYENLAVGGSVTRQVLDNQIPNVATGMSGHALVVIYTGGNDLQPYLLGSDQAAIDGFETLSPQLEETWQGIFAFFDDPENFPDGATILMNTQYDPFDGCTSPPYNISQVKLGLLVDFNTDLTARGDALDWVFVADQYASYMGHGHHFGVDSCPNYTAGQDGWMDDLIHPNEAGHANLAAVLAETAATAYVDCE